MPEANQQGAKPTLTADERRQQERQDKFYLAIASALLSNKTATPHALARKVREFTDAFLAALDGPQV